MLEMYVPYGRVYKIVDLNETTFGMEPLEHKEGIFVLENGLYRIVEPLGNKKMVRFISVKDRLIAPASPFGNKDHTFITV